MNLEKKSSIFFIFSWRKIIFSKKVGKIFANISANFRGNAPPIISMQDTLDLIEDTPASFQLEYSDPDSDDVTISITNFDPYKMEEHL